jgi:hypothetical protein
MLRHLIFGALVLASATAFAETDEIATLLKKVDIADFYTPKTDAQVDEYMACYAGRDQHLYATRYKYMVEAAARRFDVSSQMVKCLLLRESQWDKDLLSCTCATGIGQQTLENAQSLDKIIGDSATRVAGKKFSTGDLGGRWDAYMSDLKAKDWTQGCTGNMKTAEQISDENSDSYKAAASHREKGCGKNPPKCPIFKVDDRRCPAASIGGAAFYLKQIKNRLDQINAKRKKKLEWWQIDDATIALTIAYNSGQGAAFDWILQNPPGDEVESFTSLVLQNAKVSPEKNKEMRHHFRAIRNCLTQDQWGSPSANTPNRADQCQPFRQSGKDIVTTPNGSSR